MPKVQIIHKVNRQTGIFNFPGSKRVDQEKTGKGLLKNFFRNKLGKENLFKFAHSSTTNILCPRFSRYPKLLQLQFTAWF